MKKILWVFSVIAFSSLMGLYIHENFENFAVLNPSKSFLDEEEEQAIEAEELSTEEVLAEKIYHGSLSKVEFYSFAKILSGYHDRLKKSSIKDYFTDQGHFDLNPFKDIYVKKLNSSFSEEELKKLEAFFQKDLMLRFLRAEKDFHTPEGQKKSNVFARKLQESPLPEEREDLIENFDEAFHLTESTLEAMNKLSDVLQVLMEEEAKKVLSYDIVEKGVKIKLAYVFEDFTNEEIRELIDDLDVLIFQRERLQGKQTILELFEGFLDKG